MIPIGSYRPDLAESNASVARRACNVLLTRDEAGLAHKPMPGLAIAASATALPGVPEGAVSIVNSTGAYSAVVGTPTTLQRLQADYTWTQIGSGYSLPPGDTWSFARFGNNLHATNTTDGMLIYDVDLGTPPTAVAGAPKARYIFTAFNAMFALDCDTDNRLMRNSAIGNATLWQSGAKGAGTQSFADGEELICGVELNGDFAVVWQRNAIRGLFRRSDGKLYDTRLLYAGRGCVNAEAMVAVDGRAFFVDTDGFYMIGPDGSLTAIGKDKVSKSFIARLSASGLNTIQAAVDKVNTRIVFRYQDQATASETVFSNAIAYDYELGEWSEIEAQTMALFTLAGPALTLEAMDVIYGPLDSITIPLDSRAFSGGEPRLAALDASGKFGFFDGFPLEAVSETSSSISVQSNRIRSITPLTDAANAQVQVGYRDRLADEITWKPGVAMQKSGRAPVNARGKVLTFRITVPAQETWTVTRGFDGLELTSGGAR